MKNVGSSSDGVMIKKRILGVDYGDARTGLAVSDLSGLIASGVGVIKSTGMRKTAAAVADAVKKYGAELIVIGCPFNMDGSEGERAEKVKAFAGMVGELTGVSVEIYDERLTTVEAYEIMNTTGTRGKKRRDRVDELAAEIILQDYLDEKRRQVGGDEVP